MENSIDNRSSVAARLALSALLTLGAVAAPGCSDDEDPAGGDTVDAGDDASTGGDGDVNSDSGMQQQDAGNNQQQMDAGNGDGDAGGDGDGDAGADASEVVPTGFRELFSGLVPANPFQADRYTLAAFANNEKFYVAGYSTGVTSGLLDQRMAVARLTLDGKLDTTFGDEDPVDDSKRTGVATLNLKPAANATNENTENVKGIVLQADGKILVAGTIPAAAINNNAAEPVAQVDIVIARLTVDGDLDDAETTGFSAADDTKGYMIVNVADATEPFQPTGANNASIPHDDVGGLAIDSQNRIVLFARGKSTTGPDANRYVLRFLADSQVDGDFGTAGRVELSSTGEYHDNAKVGQILADDVIVSPGYTNIGGKNHILVFKMDADGEPIDAFDGDGKLEINPFVDENTPSASGFVEAYAAVHQTSGNFVTTGYGREVASAADNSLFSFRFTPAGAIDPSYGLEGKVFFNLNSMGAGTPGSIQGRNALVLDDQRIIQVGNATPTKSTGNADGLVLLLSADGDLDTSFNTTGYKAYDFGLRSDAIYGLAKSPDGKHVVAAGYAGASSGAGQNAAFDDGAVVIFATE